LDEGSMSRFPKEADVRLPPQYAPPLDQRFSPKRSGIARNDLRIGFFAL
jgi:hypothetical protein